MKLKHSGKKIISQPFSAAAEIKPATTERFAALFVPEQTCANATFTICDDNDAH